jgi:hypothetical protein
MALVCGIDNPPMFQLRSGHGIDPKAAVRAHVCPPVGSVRGSVPSEGVVAIAPAPDIGAIVITAPRAIVAMSLANMWGSLSMCVCFKAETHAIRISHRFTKSF